MAIEQGPLKGVFFLHFVLTSWCLMANWMPDGYMYYNSFFLLTLFWCIHAKENEEPVFMALIINLISILFDVVLLAIYYPHFSWTDFSRFGSGMSILNLILRPVSLYILLKIHRERTGNYGSLGIPGLDNYFGGNSQNGPYEDIDGPPAYPQSVPQNTMDTGSPFHGAHANSDEKPVIP